MNLENLSGLIPPMVTPFTDDEEVDLGQLRAEVNYLSQFDIAGLGVTGSTGEGVLLTDEEVRLITETVVNEVDGEIPVITGIIRNSTREALKTARMAREAGADGLLVTPTFYHTASNRGNYEYYRRITEEIKLPTIVYNVVPTNQIGPELMARIGSLEYMIGVKQIEAGKVTAMVDRCGDDIQVYSACDDMLYGTYAAGADGAIAAIITAAPELCVDQWKAFKAGDQQQAMEIDRRLYKVFTAYFDEKPFVGKIKSLINQLDRPVGKARQPVQEPDEERKQFIRRKLEEAGLL